MQQPPLILRVASAENWPAAAKIAIEASFERADSPEAIRLLRDMEKRECTTWWWRRKMSGHLWELFHAGGMLVLADVWGLLAVDPAVPGTCLDSTVHLRTAYIKWASGNTWTHQLDEAGLLRKMIAGWESLSGGLMRTAEDPIAAAHEGITIPRKPDLKALREIEVQPEPEIPANGLMVVSSSGGNQLTQTGKEAQREFAKIIGVVLPLVETPDLSKARQILAAEFPHAIAAIDAILNDLVGRPTIRWRPTILVGSFGCGKSRLAAALPRALGLPEPTRFDGAGASDSAFGGTPRRWSTGEPSVPLEAVRRSGIANCCVFIDEADKAASGQSPNGNFANSLLGFLDTSTNRAFPDPYLQSGVNLSMVNWILTANDERDLPAMLRDRLRLLRIPEPTADHLPALARTLAREIAAERGIDPAWGPPDLDDFELDIAARLWPTGGSIRRLRSIVEVILTKRDELALRH